MFSFNGNDKFVTSSTIPTVNLSFGLSDAKFSKTEIIIAGVVSFEESPYLPPIIIGLFSLL